jgi:hypothetical protein
MNNNYLNLIFDIEKNISNSYSNFLNEASNDYLYENIFSMMEDSKDMAREIYNYLFNKDMIKINEMDEESLHNKILELEKLLEK